MNQFIILDGIEGQAYDEVGFPIIVSGSKSVAYWAKINRQTFTAINIQQSKQYDVVSSIIFSPDGQHYAYRLKFSESM